MTHFKKIFLSFVLVALGLVGCNDEQDKKKTHTDSQEKTLETQESSKEVNVYSSRLPDLVKPVFDAFTKQTGIKVNFIFLKQGALERLKSEGEFTPADVILVADIGSIHDIVDADLTAPITSKIINQNIPAQYRSKDNLWTGLTGRVRMLARTTKDLTVEITGYDALANPAFKNRVCSRSLSHPYNVALIASYLHEYGAKKTEKWLQDFRKNIFDKPSGDDTGQINLIASGLCDIAPVNHYYYERMVATDKSLGSKVKLVPLSSMTRGVYANISGAMVSKYADNYDNAVALVEFMTDAQAQKIFADHDYEFPLNPAVANQSELFKTGMENITKTSLDAVADNRQKALQMIYKVQ
jgi:iron(III) transport system substrate-binding protein